MQTNTINLITKKENGTPYRTRFWLMLAVFYALFIARNVFFVGFPVSVYLVWIAVMAIAFNDSEIKALLISFIPLAPGFQSKYAILVCMIVLLIKFFPQMKVPVFTLIIPILMCWEFLHLGDGFFSTMEYLSGFAPFLCLTIVFSLPNKNEDMAILSRVLSFSLVVGSLILITNTLSGSGQSLGSLIEEGFRLGEVEEAENYEIVYNANGLGFLCNISIVGLLTNVYFKKAKIIDYFLIAYATFIGCLTVSKTFLLCLAGTLVLYILLQKKSVTHKTKVFLGIVVILLLAFVVVKMAVPDIIENYVDRFDTDDITTGRSYLYDFYNEFIFSSPKRLWYGIGVQNISQKVLSMEGVVVNVPHNGYQQMVIAWGIFGLVLMIVFIYFLVLHARKKNLQVPFMCYLPLIILLINITAGQFVTSGTKLLSLLFVYLMINNGGKEAVKNANESDECK